ncbi:MAG: hypothetical protein RIT81_17745 [Deltaproteobacteria bacterium]
MKILNSTPTPTTPTKTPPTTKREPPAPSAPLDDALFEVDREIQRWDGPLVAAFDVQRKTLETATDLHRADGEQTSGTKPIHFLEDADGDAFVLKVAPPALVAAEIFADRLRTLAGRPSCPVVAKTIELDGETLSGALKPRLDVDFGRHLPIDTQQWSALQRAVVLRDHPWDWLLLNIDTHLEQYVLTGEEDVPLNVDWDRAMFQPTEGRRRLDRFEEHRLFTRSPLKNHLYDDYIGRRIDLDLSLLTREAARIDALPNEDVAPLVRDLLAALEPDDRPPRFLMQFLARKHTLVDDFDRFADRLDAERERPQSTVDVRAAYQRMKSRLLTR